MDSSAKKTGLNTKKLKTVGWGVGGCTDGDNHRKQVFFCHVSDIGN